MNIQVTDRRAETSEALREYAVSKVEHLERYFSEGVVSVDVEFNTEGHQQTCELIAHLIRKKIVKASAAAEDIYAAVDAAVDKLKPQLNREKSQLREHPKRKRRGEGRHAEAPPEADSEAAEGGPSPHLVRSTVHVRKPMTPEEAIIQLEQDERRDVLVFMDAEREALSVLRRLDEGQFELLEPVY